MRITKACILAIALSLPIAAATAEPAKASTSVSLSFFYDSLSHQGDWFVNADFGYVWRPYGVSASWRPYSDGRWVYSDYGWTFVSYSSWGWGPYHYGRWTYDPYYGWVWVPGTEWGPAWVTFYEGPGWIGWAPLSPYGFTTSIRYDPRAFCFVESRYFLDSNVNRRIAPLSYNTRLVRSTRDVSRFSRQHGVMANVGLAVDRVERVTHNRVRRYHVSERTDVTRVSNTQIRGDAIEVFRPHVTGKATHAPKVKEDRTKRGRDERAVTPDRGRPSKVESPAVKSQSRSQSKAQVQAKPKERKPAPEHKPPTVSRSDARSSSRSIGSPAKFDTRDTRKPTASHATTYRSSSSSTRSDVRTARVDREPRRSVAPSAATRSKTEVKAPSNSRTVASARPSADQQRAAALERAKADQAKAAADKTRSQKGQRSTHKPQHEHKPPHH